ncbi:hypothetical protein VNO80_09529 [Phaseolus coccineus]|uniref:DUF4283 domain-containing protein n=1 Tax=Phaseolus coccineus TaxID=3886 RepID=A0AAN9N6Z4_PHACN
MLYASIVEKGCKGKTKNTYPIVFKAEVKHLEWLDNCFIGKTVETCKAKDLKESFILGGFNFIRGHYLGGNCVLLFGEDANLIKKSIEENKGWFESIFEPIIPWEKDFVVTKKYVWAHIRRLPLNLWSRQSLESIVSIIATLVEIDKTTLEMEELERIGDWEEFKNPRRHWGGDNGGGGGRLSPLSHGGHTLLRKSWVSMWKVSSVRKGVRLARTDPIISENEFSGVGSRADVALACTNRTTHLSHPLASPLTPHATQLRASPLTFVGDGGTFAPVSSSRCKSRINALSLACRLATPTRDGDLVALKTHSECGSDSAYSLVVRGPLRVVVVRSEGLSACPVTHV